MIRTKSLTSGPNPATFANIEAYCIGFSALYFWIIFAVFLSSIIGTSQTDQAIPRILGRLRSELHTIVGARIEAMPTDLPPSIRERDGGVYSWQPGRRTTILPSRQELLWTALAYLSLTAAAFTGWLISYLVPPVGWGCRNYGELTIYLIWTFSALFEDFFCFFFLRDHPSWEFWITFVKDFLCMGATMGMVIVSQVGMYNRAECYTLYGVTGLALPGMESVMNTLSYNIHSVYPAIAAAGIVLQLILLPGIVIWMYGPAMRVFLQRDDEKSNFPLLRRWYKATC